LFFLDAVFVTGTPTPHNYTLSLHDALPISSNGNQLPDGTEPAAFLRVARQRFNHIQSMNTASNIAEIQRYLTPDLYQSMHNDIRSEEHTSELQSRENLVCRLLLEKKN